MKKSYYVVAFIIAALAAVYFVFQATNPTVEQTPPPADQPVVQEDTSGQMNTAMANPASTYCEENGGTLETITNSDGSQFGMCNFDDHACEEWAYYNGECSLEEDSEKIKQALVDKGLNLSEMKVVIHKHMGKYIQGGVVPISAPAGGGYVFAVKENDEIKVLADGNGAIMCSAFGDYPDFPAYLVPECVDENGDPVAR